MTAGLQKHVSHNAGTRLVIKNLPKHYTETLLRIFLESNHYTITDCRILKTPQGRSRQFGYIGFKTTEDAAKALKAFDSTYIDTSLIRLEFAIAPGGGGLQRPWSRYSKGSSTYTDRATHNLKDAAASHVSTHKVPEFASTTNRTHINHPDGELKGSFHTELKGSFHTELTTVVSSTKAGVRPMRQHSLFASDSEGEEPRSKIAEERVTNVSDAQKDTQGDGEEISDLEWLRSKSIAMEFTPMPSADPIEDISLSSPTIAKPQDTAADIAPTEVQQEAAAAPSLVEGRLMLLNIPYSCTQAEISSLCSPFGEIEEVHVPVDEDTQRARGFAFVSYVFPEHALKAMEALNGRVFQGRLLYCKSAVSKPQALETLQIRNGNKMSGYKRRKEAELKAQADNKQTWNLLYVSANASVSTIADQLGIEKSDILDIQNSESLAVKVALSETQLLQQTKKWLKDEGIRVDAFEREGSDIYSAQYKPNVASGSSKSAEDYRSKDTLIIKHLPATSGEDELRSLFGSVGLLQRFCLSPTKLVAIVKYADRASAQRAFKRFAYKRFHDFPLFLEWAPIDIFEYNNEEVLLEEGEPFGTAAERVIHKSQDTFQADCVEALDAHRKGFGQLAAVEGEADTTQEKDEVAAGVSLFVKNLSFATTDTALHNVFHVCAGYRSSHIMKKTASKKTKSLTDTTVAPKLSMGYGFIEFGSMEHAQQALRRFNNLVLDGHPLDIRIAKSRASSSASKNASVLPPSLRQSKKHMLEKFSKKLIVKNLPFEASRKELQELFSSFGNVCALRVPKKPDGTSRGYGFVEFLTKTEALNAVEQLQHTHFYGRHLVLEPSNDEGDATVESALAKAKDDKKRSNRMIENEKKRKKLPVATNI